MKIISFHKMLLFPNERRNTMSSDSKKGKTGSSTNVQLGNLITRTPSKPQKTWNSPSVRFLTINPDTATGELAGADTSTES